MQLLKSNYVLVTMRKSRGRVVLAEDNITRGITEWYDRYSDSIFSYIFMMVRDYQLAEDLTQDTFLNAYKKYHSFEERAKPKTWLFSIARNITIDYMRKRKPISVFKDIFGTKEDTNPLPADIVEVRETSKELYRALGNIKQPYREVIVLRKLKGFSIKETSEILNWSESKVNLLFIGPFPL